MEQKDFPYLREWLLDPVVLNWYPMSNKKEVDDSLRIWWHYVKIGLVFCVDVDDRPVGVAKLYVHTSEKLKHQALFAIVIDKDYRGQGIGTLLLEFLIKTAKEKFGVTLLHLEVYETNPAYRLYERLGFKEYGRHHKFLKGSDGNYQAKVMMAKQLGELT